MNPPQSHWKSLEDILDDLRRNRQGDIEIPLIQQAAIAKSRWRVLLKRVRDNLDRSLQIKSSATAVNSACPFAAMEGQTAAKHPAVGGDLKANTEVISEGPQNAIPREIDKRTKRLSFNDPLETQSKVPMVSEPDEGSEMSEAACPIRFLDQHSPEELAQYFEDHKHELPRSHEICVKRFQTNADSIRELDAKYGSLVTMIQGLGHKHQPMLPLNPPSESPVAFKQASEPGRKIKDWAKSVSEESALNENTEERRVEHFDRPLKDIRVGESPSRPWGIPIPSKYLDAMEDEGEGLPPKVVHPQGTKGQCPVNHQVTTAQPEIIPNPPRTNHQAGNTRDPDQIQASRTHHNRKTLIANRANALFAAKTLPENVEIDNHGALLLGFDREDLKQYLSSMKYG